MEVQYGFVILKMLDLQKAVVILHVTFFSLMLTGSMILLMKGHYYRRNLSLNKFPACDMGDKIV